MSPAKPRPSAAATNEADVRLGPLLAVPALLREAGVDLDAREFRRYGSARRLYHFHVDHADAY